MSNLFPPVGVQVRVIASNRAVSRVQQSASMKEPSVSKIGLPGPQSKESRTGGWFVSICHGESGARAGIALRTVASFFSGRGFSLGKDCAPAKPDQASNTNTTTIVFNGMNGFMTLLSFLFPAELIF